MAAIIAMPVFAQSTTTSGQTQTPPPTQTPLPKPAPFPGANPPAPNKPATPTPQPTATTPAPPATAGSIQEGSSIDPRLAGIPIYPGAELLESFDGGSSQRVFLFGSTMPYSDVLAFYKTQLRSGGTEVFKTPAMQQFDLGSFRAESMNFRPSVVLKDYGGAGAAYLHVVGTTEKKYQTVIQIVPVTK